MPRLHPDALAIDAGEAPLPTLSSFATFPVDETDDRYELTLDETHDLLAPERYRLDVTTDGAEVRASSLRGFLYAVQTIKQLLPAGPP